VTDSPEVTRTGSLWRLVLRILGGDWSAPPDLPAMLQTVVSIAVALAAIGVTTVVLLALDSRLEAGHLVVGYLLPTVVIAMHYGGMLAILTSFFSGLAAAYFLFPPKFSFYIAEPQHVAELGFVLLLAITAGKAVARN